MNFAAAIRLALEGVKGVTRIVEGVHSSVARPRARPSASAMIGNWAGISGLVYRSIHGTTNLVGMGLDSALAGAQKLIEVLPGEVGRWR